MSGPRLAKARNVAFSLAVFLFVGIAAEIVARFLWSPTYGYSTLGWAVTPNRQYTWTVQDSPGRFRQITSTYHTHGFKRWPLGRGERVLVIGDSVTEMTRVSDGEEWYSHLERRWPRIRWFVFGGGGYGTLQEYLVLRNVLDEIKPAVVLWQWCSNDYTNNLWKFDRLTYPFNNLARRPYLENGRVVLRLPLPAWWLRDWCRICDRGLLLYDEMRQKKAYSDGSIVALKRWMDEHPETVEPLQAEAEAASLDTLRLVRLALPNVPIYFLNPCSTITESDRRICKAVGFVPVDGWWEYASQDPRYQVPHDGHWNLAGNTAAGQWLVRYFEAQGVFGP